MVKKRGLGKSLDALLSYKNPSYDNTVSDETPLQDTFCELPIDHIQRGKYQPRREMDTQALDELAESIRAQGIIQPLIVRPIGDRYEIIAGERRWRAAKIAGLHTVPCLIRSISDESALAMALIENIQRENLNPIEESMALQRLLEEFGMTHQQVAQAIGKSRTTITNLLRLLSLPEEIRNLLAQGQLEMGHARALITLPEIHQLKAAQLIMSKQLSVRETENLVKQLQAQPNEKATSDKPIDPDIVRLQDDLTKQLRLKVAIQCNAKGKGKLVIHYRSLAELDHLLGHFQD
jgi:ParB family chromosome partitioning protein